ncbi:hypothetical protein LEN26_012575 [Aphanomyces euteiches]|nr:hypothetical protein AeMF1_010377 [Aphanomyces euteiches]KAH9117588.1 hypothetical protein LEN26_012575 [Aphanomyces euteiches]KAH9190110.1 hypothetical protein AeNC1_007912 [Aphanomyces euteiches]
MMEISSSHANLVHFGVQRNFDAQIEEQRHVLDDLTDREKMTTFLGYRPFLGLFGKSLEQTRREPAQRRWVCKGSIKRSEAMYIVANRTAGVTTAFYLVVKTTGSALTTSMEKNSSLYKAVMAMPLGMSSGIGLSQERRHIHTPIKLAQLGGPSILSSDSVIL